MSMKNQPLTLCELHSIYKDTPEDFLVETHVDLYFYYSTLTILIDERRSAGLSRISQKISFTLKVIWSDSSKFKQQFFPAEDLTATKSKHATVLHCLEELSKKHEEAENLNYYCLPTPKKSIGSSFLKDDLFCHHIHEERNHPKRHIRISFRVQLDNNRLFLF